MRDEEWRGECPACGGADFTSLTELRIHEWDVHGSAALLEAESVPARAVSDVALPGGVR